MKLTTKLLLILLIVLIGFISVADLILRPGHPITFDGHVHMTTMNQFAQSLNDGEFPVTWSNNFANYGIPLPLFAHQLPAYLGAILILLGLSTEAAYIIIMVFSVILSGILFYIFFRKYADQTLSFTATLLATFFPYRALNIYTRGALPEILSTVFLPVLFLGVWNLQQKKYYKAIVLILLGTFAVAVTHPMMLLIFSIPLSIYFISGLDKKTWKKQILLAGASAGLGTLMASYYLIPLTLEMKYLYQSLLSSQIKPDRFLSIKQLYDPSWFYTFTHPGPRGNYIKLGIFEFIIFISAITTLLFSKLKLFKKYINNTAEYSKNNKQLIVWTLMSAISIILMLPITIALYSLPVFNQIQYPWRFLNILQFLIPGLFIMIVLRIPALKNRVFLLSIIIVTFWFRIPQFYGKNYIIQPESDYQFNQANLHSVNMNPIWTSDSEDYAVRTVQAEIIEGKGDLEFIEIKNASRKYHVTSNEEVRLIDYTFYFSGWNVYVDNKPITFEFQDPKYRGVITYKVPAGSHDVEVKYEPTKIRSLATIITILGTVASIGFLIFIKKKNN